MIENLVYATATPSAWDPEGIRTLGSACVDTGGTLSIVSESAEDSMAHVIEASQGLSFASAYTAGSFESSIVARYDAVVEFSGDDPTTGQIVNTLDLSTGTLNSAGACTPTPADANGPERHEFSFTASGTGTVVIDCVLPLGPGKFGEQEVTPYFIKCDISVSDWSYADSANKLGIKTTLITASSNADSNTARSCANGICVGEGFGPAIEWVETAAEDGTQFPIGFVEPTVADFVNFEAWWYFDSPGAGATSTPAVWDPAIGFGELKGSDGNSVLNSLPI